MKRVIPLALVAAFSLSVVYSVQAQDLDAAKDICRYARDVLYEGEHRSAWETPCKAAEPDMKALAHVAEMDSFMKYGYGEAAYGADRRREQIRELYKLFTSDEFIRIKDDSDPDGSKKVRLCMTKLNCLNVWDPKDADKLDNIDPPINARTFPTWLGKEEANKMLPFFFTAQAEKLRVEKYNSLNVPLDEGKRKLFCNDGANAAQCARFEQVQKELETIKTMINYIATRGMKDAEEAGRTFDNALARGKGSETAVATSAADWDMARSNSELPIRPASKLSPDGKAPPLAVTPAPADDSYSAKAKALGAAGMLLLSGVGAWGLKKWNMRSAESKAEDEIEAEDKTAEVAARVPYNAQGYWVAEGVVLDRDQIKVIDDILDQADRSNPLDEERGKEIAKYITAKKGFRGYGIDTPVFYAADQVQTMVSGGQIKFKAK